MFPLRLPSLRALLLLSFALLAGGGCETSPPPAAPPPPPTFPVHADIQTDRAGVPHIEARDQRSLFYALGFVEARDRLWQLEYFHMLADGRLADMLGNSSLESDGLMRTLDLRSRARKTWEGVGADSDLGRRIIAFSAGVNAYVAEIRAGRQPVPRGLALAHLAAEPWSPEASLEVMYLMGLDLDLDTDPLDRARWAEKHGLAEFWKRWRLSEHDIVYITGDCNAPAGDPRMALPPWGPGASNVFAAGGSRTLSGKPILANDTHLSHVEPSQWYASAWEVKDTLCAAGFGVPGVPVMVSGRNRKVAWGITSLGAMVTWVWAESLDASNHHYLSDGTWKGIQEKPLGLSYRLGPFKLPLFWIKARFTEHGPIVRSNSRAHRAWTLAWYPMEDLPQQLHSAAPELAQTAREAADAFRGVPTPCLNIVAADRDGGLAYATCGLVPARSEAQSPLPLDGSRRETNWPPPIGPDSMPRAQDPSCDYLVNANNKPPTGAYPLWLGNYYADYRAVRLNTMLRNARGMNEDSMIAVQNDALSPQWIRFAPRMLGLLAGRAPGAEAAAARETLRTWNGRPDSSAVAPTIFRAWYIAAATRLESAGYDGYLDALLDDRAGSPDSLKGPALGALLAGALDTAVAQLHARLGPMSSKWAWGRVHGAHFVSPLEKRDPAFATAHPWVSGDRYSVNFSGLWRTGNMEVTNGPSMRQVSDLSQDSTLLLIVPPGNSDEPASPHFSDHLQRWASGKYVRVRLGAPLEADTESRVHLESTGSR